MLPTCAIRHIGLFDLIVKQRAMIHSHGYELITSRAESTATSFQALMLVKGCKRTQLTGSNGDRLKVADAQKHQTAHGCNSNVACDIRSKVRKKICYPITLDEPRQLMAHQLYRRSVAVVVGADCQVRPFTCMRPGRRGGTDCMRD
jgi:hypothetical protein